MKKKHDWNTWENYLKVHEKVLRTFSGNILTQNPSYIVQRITPNYYTLELSRMELLTVKSNKVLVKLEKDIFVKDGARKKIAKLFNYSYHAWEKKPPKNLIRYCGPHQNHNTFHHCHDYTVKPMRTIKIPDDKYPHVSEFLKEVIESF